MNTHNVLRDVERPKFRQSSRFLLLFLFTAAIYILRSSRRETIFSLKSRRPRLFYFFFSLSFLYLSSSFSFVGRRKKLFVFKTQSASPSKFSFSEQMARGASGNLPKGLVFLPFFFFYFFFLLFLIYTHFIFSLPERPRDDDEVDGHSGRLHPRASINRLEKRRRPKFTETRYSALPIRLNRMLGIRSTALKTYKTRRDVVRVLRVKASGGRATPVLQYRSALFLLGQ